MKFKLDENLSLDVAAPLTKDGHDVDTVLSEQLSGSEDEAIFAACITTGLALITLDLDFSNPFRFPPEGTEGILVIRPPRPTLAAIKDTLISILPELGKQPLKGRLWIVEPGRLRIYDPHED